MLTTWLETSFPKINLETVSDYKAANAVHLIDNHPRKISDFKAAIEAFIKKIGLSKRLKIADGADILPAPSAYKINTNAIGDYEMPLAIIYLFKSIIIESI